MGSWISLTGLQGLNACFTEELAENGPVRFSTSGHGLSGVATVMEKGASDSSELLFRFTTYFASCSIFIPVSSDRESRRLCSPPGFNQWSMSTVVEHLD
jgi:hypothetical protein